MPRQPAILELAGGKSRRQRIWEALRSLAGRGDGACSADDLAQRSRVDPDTIRDYLKSLAAGGYVRVLSPEAPRAGGRGVKNRYLLARDNGVEAPRVRRDGTAVTQGRGTEALWGAMTALDQFDHWLIADLAQVRPSTAATYCQLLGKAGLLEVVTPGKGKGRGGQPTVWAVAPRHRTKPRAPMITRLKTVYDPNTHQILWAEGADAAADAIEIGEAL